MSLQHEHDRRILGSSEEPNWRTPKALVERLFEEFPICIDLAADAGDTVCERWLGPGSLRWCTRCQTTQQDESCLFGTDEHDPTPPVEDALAFDDWSQFIPRYAYGFLNPPYSRKLKLPIKPWIERCWSTALNGRGVIAVLPAAIQTDWWQRYVWAGDVAADEIRFLPHRVSFDPPPGVETSNNANVNTAIVIWRPLRPFVGPWTPHVRYWSYR